MARVVAYIPDLLFGSQVQGTLRAAGHELELVANASDVGHWLAGADVLVFDLTDDVPGRIDSFEALKKGSARIPALAFYAHVEAETRASAQAAGFDLVVPRSRMARDGAQLVEGLVTQQTSDSG
ncbi:MAG TPA: hypothetical protein VFW38_05735 [Solirubrobacteraceae bacterium]|nr:hypothetical protein [Solirubrobacteraceae bacterium]